MPVRGDGGGPPPRVFRGIALRVLLFNVLVIFIPVVAILLLDTYERELLDLLERGLVQQARMLQAALATSASFDAETAQDVLGALEQRHEARIRVVDDAGRLIADSSVIAARSEPSVQRRADEEAIRESLPYRIASFPVRTLRRLLGAQSAPVSAADLYDTAVADTPAEAGPPVLSGPEIQAALAGRYGAATRVSAGQVSVTLYSAVPVRREGTVVGAVLVSQSTYRILQSLYAVRLDIFSVLLYGSAAAVVLSIFLSLTIIRPLRSLQTRALALVDSHGRLTGELALSTRRDEIGVLTNALRDLTGQVREHTHHVEAFAADASHELRNPLASIRAACEVALETDDEQTRRRFLQQALSDVHRSERLLAGLRELSRIDARTDDAESESGEGGPLGPLLSSAVAAAQARDPQRTYRFEIAPPADGSTIHMPAWALERVVRNLTENAAGFAPDGSEVTVTARAEAGEVVVTVSDHGPGLRDCEAIFRRFTTDRPERGDHLGLGLAIVASILSRYGGSITATNRPDGHGAVFTFHIRVRA